MYLRGARREASQPRNFVNSQFRQPGLTPPLNSQGRTDSFVDGDGTTPRTSQGCEGPRPATLSLDNYGPKRAVNSARNKKRRRKRAYQRIQSGLTIGGNLKFITLTSSPTSDPARLGRDLCALVKRIRRGSSRDSFFSDRHRPSWKFEYVRVRVPGEGYGVLHIIARGSYVPQRWLSHAWGSIRGAQIVDIRAITRTPGRVGNYLISQYVSNQEGVTHLSWSWGWVFPGFCLRWSYYRKVFGQCVVQVWVQHLRAYRHSLDEWGKDPPPLFLGIDKAAAYEFDLIRLGYGNLGRGLISSNLQPSTGVSKLPPIYVGRKHG